VPGRVEQARFLRQFARVAHECTLGRRLDWAVMALFTAEGQAPAAAGVIANACDSNVHACHAPITCAHSAASTVKKCESGPLGGMP